MFLHVSLRRNTNPNYRMDHSERSNIQMVTFSKNYKRYEYWFFIHSLEAFILMPLDKESHREMPFIFNSDIFEHVDETLKTVKHDLKFMNIFCFGKESFLSSNNIEDMIGTTPISGENLIAYSAVVPKETDDISFLMTIKILFNVNTGKLDTFERFHAYKDKYSCKLNLNPIIEECYWPSFKRKFMTIHAATKIEKNVYDILFQDSPVVQMINL